jgi:hypothetical protein
MNSSNNERIADRKTLCEASVPLLFHLRQMSRFRFNRRPEAVLLSFSTETSLFRLPAGHTNSLGNSQKVKI